VLVLQRLKPELLKLVLDRKRELGLAGHLLREHDEHVDTECECSRVWHLEPPIGAG
jgi:hypothetical protein